MNIKEAMEFITSTQKFGQNLGLARMECMLEKLGNPQNDLKAIHIAGTNGKGSVASITTEVLMQHGYSVGLYTSPYIEEFNERIQIDRKNISVTAAALGGYRNLLFAAQILTSNGIRIGANLFQRTGSYNLTAM